MKFSKFFNVFFAVVMFAFANMSIAQPTSVTEDGFSDAAAAWLKKYPVVDTCAQSMAKANGGARYSVFGEFIGVCSKKHLTAKEMSSTVTVTAPVVAVKKVKMMGDQLDKNPNAKPNGSAEVRNKKNGKAWQDINGIMHFPDGSASNGPVD